MDKKLEEIKESNLGKSTNELTEDSFDPFTPDFISDYQNWKVSKKYGSVKDSSELQRAIRQTQNKNLWNTVFPPNQPRRDQIKHEELKLYNDLTEDVSNEANPIMEEEIEDMN